MPRHLKERMTETRRIRVLGIDPGSRLCGYGVVDEVPGGFVHVDCGAIAPSPKQPLEKRLDKIYRGLFAIVEKYQPTVAAVETMFFAVNAKSAIILGQARGAALLAMAHAGLPVILMRPVVLPGDARLDLTVTTTTVTKPLLARALRSALERTLLGRTTPVATESHRVFDAGLAQRHPLRILLAEDNEESIKVMSDYLKSRGCRVVVARDGAAAVERAREERPDIILMDIQMPGLDGLEATCRLRAEADPAVAAVPIVALTALAMPGDRERCLAAGANEYLSKPVSLKRLVQVIETQLSRS